MHTPNAYDHDDPLPLSLGPPIRPNPVTEIPVTGWHDARETMLSDRSHPLAPKLVWPFPVAEKKPAQTPEAIAFDRRMWTWRDFLNHYGALSSASAAR